MEIRSRTIGKLAAGVVLLMAATLAADVAVHSNGINVLGNASSMPGNALVRAELSNYSASSAAVYGYAPTTGTAVYGRGTGGVGVSAMSTSSYGVWGRSTNSWGGYFKSTNGYGLVVETDGTEIFDFGVKVSSNWGHGIFVTSLHNQGVRAEVGDLSAGKSMPGGSWGTVGIGQSGGAWGSSWNNWGVYGDSHNYRGVQGNTDRADRNYGLHT